MSRHEKNIVRDVEKKADDVHFLTVFAEWIDLPRYNPENEDYSLLLEISNPKRTPEIEHFLESVRFDVKKRLDSRDYQHAIDIMGDAFLEAKRRFKPEMQQTVNRFLWFRAGFIFEHRATFGDSKDRKVGNPERTATFLSAAICYMNADREIGYMSDYTLRVAESLGGAGGTFGYFAGMALDKFFDGGYSLLHMDDPGDQAIAKDLKRRSHGNERNVPGGGESGFIDINDLPDAKNN